MAAGVVSTSLNVDLLSRMTFSTFGVGTLVTKRQRLHFEAGDFLDVLNIS